MRSKIAKRILKETPQDLKDFVNQYAINLIESKKFTCINNDFKTLERCKSQCDKCKEYEESFK